MEKIFKKFTPVSRVRVSTVGFDSLYDKPLVKANDVGIFIRTKVDDSVSTASLRMKLARFFVPWSNVRYIEY